MSEDDGNESGRDTVEGSPTSDTSTSPRGNGAYRYLNNNNRPPLAGGLAPLTPPTEQYRSPCGIRTMVVPPMRVQSNNNTRGTEERVQRTGQWEKKYFLIHFCWLPVVLSKKKFNFFILILCKYVFLVPPVMWSVTCALAVFDLQVIWMQSGLTAP